MICVNMLDLSILMLYLYFMKRQRIVKVSGNYRYRAYDVEKRYININIGGSKPD